jgi:hypothetical protein
MFTDEIEQDETMSKCILSATNALLNWIKLLPFPALTGTSSPYQFHVRLLAVKTGGFQFNLAGSILLFPRVLSFSNAFSRCSSIASLTTIIHE